MKWFKPEEFDSPDSPGSGNLMNQDFLRVLDQIREDVKVPMRINSGYRTEMHNAEVGGKPGSAHTKGLAADIHVSSSGIMFLLVKYALANGVRRIGIGKNFIHLDMDASLPNPCIWVY